MADTLSRAQVIVTRMWSRQFSRRLKGCCSTQTLSTQKRGRAPLKNFLETNGLEPCEDGQLVLKRAFTAAGANRQFINGSPTTLNTLATLGEVIAYDYPEVDFAKVDDLLETISLLRPEVVINAVAYTAVDRAESQPELAHLVNAAAPAALARLALEKQIPFIHYSTDYVFDGTSQEPYSEDAPTRPLGIYGATKLAAA